MDSLEMSDLEKSTLSPVKKLKPSPAMSFTQGTQLITGQNKSLSRFVLDKGHPVPELPGRERGLPSTLNIL